MSRWDKLYHQSPQAREEAILRVLKGYDGFAREAMQTLLRSGAIKPQVKEPAQ